MQCLLCVQFTETSNQRMDQESTDVVVFTKFYISFYLQYCCHMLLVCVCQAYFHCQMSYFIRITLKNEILFSTFSVLKMCAIMTKVNHGLPLLITTVKILGNSVVVVAPNSPSTHQQLRKCFRLLFLSFFQ
jgi:hypothetical protein